MLISSHRHTTEDLALWAAYEAADRLHGATLDAKIEHATNVVRRFAEQACYAGVSWGKDSVAVAHLAACAVPTIRLRWVRWKAHENPDCERVRDAFLQRHLTIDYAEIIAPDDDNDTGTQGFRMLSEACGLRRITGLRADESGPRKISARWHGVATEASCRPLLWWNIPDVMGYLARYDLPVHPAYAMLGGGRWSRKALRVDSLGGERGDQFGRAQWEREYYGDVLRRQEKRHAQPKQGPCHYDRRGENSQK